MTKVFGDLNGNYIEVRTRISLTTKKHYQSASKAGLAFSNGEAYHKVLEPQNDPDLILLKSSILTLKEGGKEVKNPSWDAINASVENLDNMEEAIEHIKRENRLGDYAVISSASIEKLQEMRTNILSNLEYVEKEIEKRGN